jgi:hypothetical protein
MAGLDMAALLGPDVPGVRAAAAEARAILVELGAKPVIARLDRLVAAEKPPVGGPTSTTPTEPEASVVGSD